MSSFVGFHVTVRPRVGTIDLRGDMETCWLWLNFECCVRGVVAIRIEYDLFLISSILYKFVPCWLYFLWRRIIMRCFRAFSFLGSSASPFRTKDLPSLLQGLRVGPALWLKRQSLASWPRRTGRSLRRPAEASLWATSARLRLSSRLLKALANAWSVNRNSIVCHAGFKPFNIMFIIIKRSLLRFWYLLYVVFNGP